MSMKMQKKPGKICTTDADAVTAKTKEIVDNKAIIATHIAILLLVFWNGILYNVSISLTVEVQCEEKF